MQIMTLTLSSSPSFLHTFPFRSLSLSLLPPKQNQPATKLHSECEVDISICVDCFVGWRLHCDKKKNEEVANLFAAIYRPIHTVRYCLCLILPVNRDAFLFFCTKFVLTKMRNVKLWHFLVLFLRFQRPPIMVLFLNCR